MAIKFEFSENEHFENTTLEKKFWWRRSKDGWAGLVSEPVKINWKADKDLTSGMLDRAIKVWEAEKAGKEDATAVKELQKQMEETGLGGLSFFAWFGYRGRAISAEEDREAFKEEEEKRQARQQGKEVDAMDEDEEDDDDEDDDEYENEIFPTADDLAVCIAEELWPNAIKYFSEFVEENIIDVEEEGSVEDSD